MTQVGKSAIKGAEEALEYAMRREHNKTVEYAMNPNNPNFARANKDFSTIMCFAFRYALGRQSTAPSFVQDYIKNHLQYFEVWELEQLIEEVDSQARFHHLGDPTIDEPMWRQFQRDLALEISRRSGNLPKGKSTLNELDKQVNSATMKATGVTVCTQTDTEVKTGYSLNGDNNEE